MVVHADAHVDLRRAAPVVDAIELLMGAARTIRGKAGRE